MVPSVNIYLPYVIKKSNVRRMKNPFRRTKCSQKSFFSFLWKETTAFQIRVFFNPKWYSSTISWNTIPYKYVKRLIWKIHMGWIQTTSSGIAVCQGASSTAAHAGAMPGVHSKGCRTSRQQGSCFATTLLTQAVTCFLLQKTGKGRIFTLCLAPWFGQSDMSLAPQNYCKD